MNTRNESFKAINSSGIRYTQKQVAEHYLLESKEPVTSRSLAKILGFERTSITRIIKDLETEGKLHCVYVDRCPDTGHKVNFYHLKSKMKAIDIQSPNV